MSQVSFAADLDKSDPLWTNNLTALGQSKSYFAHCISSFSQYSNFRVALSF